MHLLAPEGAGDAAAITGVRAAVTTGICLVSAAEGAVMGEWDVRYLGSTPRAPATATFSFERPADLDYAPGQFFFVMLPPDAATGRPIEHHFSFSSSPTEPRVEFTTRLTGSDFKRRMEATRPGDVVHVAGPDGAFVLSPDMRKVAFVCAGIGVTPARSTIRWAADTGSDVDIVLLYANRDLEQAAFREEFGALTTASIRVEHVLSRPGPEWRGASGHIDADLVRRLVPDWSERHFFVSGQATVVDALTRVLSNDVGVAPDHVMSEHFPGYADKA